MARSSSRRWPICTMTGSGRAAATQKMRDEFDRFLRGGKTDARQRFAGQMVEAFEREREMGAAFVVGHGVDFVHDDGFDGSEDFAAFRGGQEDVKRLGSSDQDVRRARQHRAALVGERVSGAHGGANLRHEDAALSGELQEFRRAEFPDFSECRCSAP